ncbi:CD225/dispanin family protein [Prevotella sp. HUN102]|uniref:CD225/dispanin family protein n=1 Tax=Prevotella sp. HUN102 TaxID=1392486 RepID=UPI000A9F7362|nr:CD225/dispanin family protein [Prevotella sp. HUN102]
MDNYQNQNENLNNINNNQMNADTSTPPENHLVMAILTTIFCCLPLGIVAIVKASSVKSLYYSGQKEAALLAAQEAKKWSTWGIIGGLTVGALYFILMFVLGLGSYMLG